MRFKLIIAVVPDTLTETIAKGVREGGATGCTVLTNARGEGLKQARTFLGLNLTGARDVILTIVEEHMSRAILELIERIGDFERKPGSGIALMIDVEDAVGLGSQLGVIKSEIEEKI